MAPSSSSPRTTPTWIVPTVRGVHQFEIDRYSLHKGLGAGNPVTSGTFVAGGYEWAVLFYPDGRSTSPGHNLMCVSVYVKLLTKDAKAKAFVDLRPVDRTTGLSCSVHPCQLMYFEEKHALGGQPIESGIFYFMFRNDLVESSPYIRGDCFTIECVLDVVQEPLVTPAMRTAREAEVLVPSSDLSKHLGELLESQVGADVTFLVQGESFGAHRMVLAMRSPVFKAELYGPMKEKHARGVAIEDMQPLVFGALLHFIYTDKLLLPGGLGAEEYREVIRHLLVAADRYAMERLKAICELVLCRTIDAEVLADTLTLADRHYCKGLQDVCDQFMSSVGLEG